MKDETIRQRTLLSETEQNYVKIIYLLEQEAQPVTTRQLAARLGLKLASVSEMVKRLAQEHKEPYVTHAPYQQIALTPQGRQVAIELIRHQRLLELFFVQVLDMPWDRVHADAERLAPLISEELEEHIASKLGQPTRDPHGNPIPTREGLVEQSDDLPLDTFSAGSCVRIVQVPDEDPALLRYLSGLGVVPGATIVLESYIPYGNVFTIRVGEATYPLAGTIAHQISASGVSYEKDERN
jgi:DtxR family Mn-dependent transcriptional regulator